MNFTLTRYGFGRTSTLGMLEEGGELLAFIIEDERRKVKVKGETCIPTGTYEVKLKTDSPKFQAAYAARFPAIHKGMLWLQNVPGFEFVYIHAGNTEKDTDGCLLPNVKPVALPTGEFRGEDSGTAYVAVYKRALAALDKGEKVTITITEREAA